MRKALVLVPLTALLAGCGGGSKTGKEQRRVTFTGPPLKTITVVETEFKLSPNRIAVQKPGNYVFLGMNRGHVNHALELEGNGLDDTSPSVGPGKTTTLKVVLSKTGSYELYCPLDGHKERGMKATVVLGKGAAAPTQTSTGPSETNDRGY
jgi:plastocyanin